MGGSQRVNRTRTKQAGSKAVSAARRSAGGGRGGVYAGVAVIVVLAVVVTIGVLTSRARHAEATAIPPVRVSASYPVGVRDGVVVAGSPSAATAVDAYEDFLCPVCGEFEAQHATKIQQALAAGRITIRYHMLNLLDERSNPPGYSLRAASSGMCAAKSNIFPSYHASLYGKQPEEGAAGYSADQLVALGRALGAGGDFESCVRSGVHDGEVRAQMSAAGSNQALRQQGSSGPTFGTPTVLVNGTIISVLSPAGSAQFDQLIS